LKGSGLKCVNREWLGPTSGPSGVRVASATPLWRV
jgi:hypothetical protein